MSSITVYPGRVSGVIAAPPYIGEAMLALVMAAITRRSVHGAGNSRGVLSLLRGLEALGAQYRQEADTITFYTVPSENEAVVDCTPFRETLALLLPVALSIGGRYTFLYKRAHRLDDVFSLLDENEVDYSVDEDRITISGQFQSTQIRIGNVPEPFASGLLIALPLLKNTTLVYQNKGLKQHLRLTQDIMCKYGQSVSDFPSFTLQAHDSLPPNFCYRVNGDYDSAAYFLLAGLIGGDAGVTGLMPSSQQPQKRIVDWLQDNNMGVQEMNGAVFSKKRRVANFDIDAAEHAQALPLLGALFCVGHGNAVIKNGYRLSVSGQRLLGEIVSAFSAIGADIAHMGSDVVITGKRKLYGGAACTTDARIVMALAALAPSCENAVVIDGAHIVDRICPDFYKKLASLGVLVQ